MSEGVDMNSPAVKESEAEFQLRMVNRLLDSLGAPTTIYNPFDREDQPLNEAGRIDLLLDPKNEGLTRDRIEAMLARVAVVRPTPQEAPEGFWPSKLSTNVDEGAVVRPTRDQLAGFLADTRNDDLPHPFRTGVEPRDFDLADALLKAFWPLAVSDSQETPR